MFKVISIFFTKVGSTTGSGTACSKVWNIKIAPNRPGVCLRSAVNKTIISDSSATVPVLGVVLTQSPSMVVDQCKSAFPILRIVTVRWFSVSEKSIKSTSISAIPVAKIAWMRSDLTLSRFPLS